MLTLQWGLIDIVKVVSCSNQWVWFNHAIYSVWKCVEVGLEMNHEGLVQYMPAKYIHLHLFCALALLLVHLCTLYLQIYCSILRLIFMHCILG